MGLKENIKAERRRCHMTLEDVASFLGISRQTVQKYESGVVSNIPSDKIERLATLFSTTPARLMGWESVPTAMASEQPQSRIPLLGEISCGQPVFAAEEYDQFVASSIPADFCLRAKGDSMIGARIFDGDLVFVKSQSTVNNGEIAVVVIDDEATLKRAYFTGHSLTLVAENPAYAPMVFTPEGGKSIAILGKAIAFLSKLS